MFLDYFKLKPKPTIGVGALVFNSGRVLLIRRGKPPAMGLWSVPGGKQEAGESLVQACEREVWEETGLRVQVQGVVAVVERQREGFHYVIIDFLAILANPDLVCPTAASDVTDVQWIAMDALADLPLVEGLAEILQRSYRQVQDGQAYGLLAAKHSDMDFILTGYS